jgi:hypothetical protein
LFSPIFTFSRFSSDSGSLGLHQKFEFFTKIDKAMKASISYFPNTSKKSSKTGKIPLYTRVCFRGSKAEERLNIEVPETVLAKWEPMTMRFSDRTLSANQMLNSYDHR